MGKTVLGRSLDHLMSEAKAPGSPGGVAAPPPGPAPGLAGLVRGASRPAEPEPPSLPAAPRRFSGGKRLLQLSLVLADVLLVALAVRLVVTNDAPLSLAGAALCCAAIIAGAWLTCLAFWMDGKEP